MIEFKAECGHTVRAKDEDAGNVVRCSYCGRTAQVPEDEKNDLSFLFRDVQQQEESPRKRRSMASFFKKSKNSGFNPFPIIFRLCYVALLFIVLWVVGTKFVWPLFDPDARSRRLATGRSDPAPAQQAEDAGRTRGAGPLGLVGLDRSNGLYVASSPPGASVFCIEESKAAPSGRVANMASCARFQANGQPTRMTDGSFLVEVAFAWNDPRLSDSSLSGYQSYLQFRRAVEKASASSRTQLANQYFLPDEASNVFIDETPDQIYIVRQYRGITVRQGQSPGVRALFLPRFQTRDDGYFAIEPLLHGYIPNQKAYNFDESHVLGELAYYGVTAGDQTHVVQALTRIGVIPYVTPDGMIRLFKIGIHDGVFATRLLGAAKP